MAWLCTYVSLCAVSRACIRYDGAVNTTDVHNNNEKSEKNNNNK